MNHLGFVVENLDALHDDMIASGVILPKGVHRFADGNYLMVEAPDRVLIELFEPQRDAISPRLQAWFEVGDVDPRLHPIAWPPSSPTLD